MADKQVTITELKTFIDAVEFASDSEDWIPSERQWKRIRSMIDSLVSDKPAEPPRPAPVEHPVTYASSGMNGGGYPPQHNGGHMMMPPPAPLAGPFAQGGQAPVRTPDLDTSHGKPYQSTFA